MKAQKGQSECSTVTQLLIERIRIHIQFHPILGTEFITGQHCLLSSYHAYPGLIIRLISFCVSSASHCLSIQLVALFPSSLTKGHGRSGDRVLPPQRTLRKGLSPFLESPALLGHPLLSLPSDALLREVICPDTSEPQPTVWLRSFGLFFGFFQAGRCAARPLRLYLSLKFWLEIQLLRILWFI